MRLISKALIFTSLLLFPLFLSAQEADTTDNDITKDDIILVLSIFDGQPVSTVISKAEYFIETGKDAVQKAFFASAAYDYYRSSRIMGYDEAAIYIADNYFLNGKYRHPDPDKYLELKLFAEYNRQSLIGMRAPELNLQNAIGENVSLRNSPGDYKILYFYDDECPICKRRIPALMQYFQDITGFNVTFYRVYTQDQRDRWNAYVKEMKSKYPLPSTVNLVDVWDPELSSEFPKLYGVLSTPLLFVIDRNNRIIGRSLTPNALSQVIEIDKSQPKGMEILFESIFAPLVANSSVGTDTTSIIEAIDVFYEDSKDNPDLFHESMYSLYQYLKKDSDYDLQRGAAYLAKKYIVEMPKMWEGVIFNMEEETHGSIIKAEYPSVKAFLDETALAVNLFYRNQLGRPVSDLSLRTVDKKPFSIYSVDAEFTVLYFYSTNCAICTAVTEDMKKLYDEYADNNVQFIGIYTGTDKKWRKYPGANGFKWINVWDKDRKSGMFSKYDLDGLPRIYLLDKDKKALGKDISPAILEDVLKYLFPKEEAAVESNPQ